MGDYIKFDIGPARDPPFPNGLYEIRWANRYKNAVVAMFLGSVVILAATIVLHSSHAIGNTAHVLYPVTTDLSYETVSINRTADEIIVSYVRELNYKIIGYIDITILLSVSLGLDLVYYAQLLYTANFSLHRVPITSTVSIWKWINYGASGGVILLICALVVGVSDLFNMIYIQFLHGIISGLFYIMERRNANLLRRIRNDGRRKVKWVYVIFPTVLMSMEFMFIIVYFVYLLANSSEGSHVWFNIAMFFTSQIMFVALAVMTIHTYYDVAAFENFKFSMMIPRSLSRMLVSAMAKLAMFVCIVVVSATDLPLKDL